MTLPRTETAWLRTGFPRAKVWISLESPELAGWKRSCHGAIIMELARNLPFRFQDKLFLGRYFTGGTLL